MKRPRILVLTSRFPEPPIGGDRLRIYRICSELSRHATLDLLTLCETDGERTATSKSGLFHSIRRLDLNPLAARARALGAVMGTKPLQIAYYRTRQYAAALASMVNDYDAVLGHLVRMGDYIRKPVGNVVRVVEATDAISLNYSRIPPDISHYSPKVLAYQLERERLLQYERALPKQFDLVSFVSSVDTDFLYPERPANVIVATNGVDLEQFPFIGPGRDRRIVFIGNITSEQNFDACVFFAKHVLPHLDGFHFHVIGRVPGNKAAALAAYPRVVVAGEVASVAQAAAGAFAAVCPVRIGAGVQNKMLEYLAMGIPAVSSSIGIEGLGLVHERDVLRADDPAAMAHALTRLWNEPALADQLAVAGRKYVAVSHSWDRTLAPMMHAMFTAIEQRKFVSLADR